MNFPPRAGRVSGRATPSLRHAPRAKLQRTNPGSSPLSLRGILFRRSGPALSNVALMGVKRMSAYTAAKGAVASLTRAMAADFAPHVRVNAIAPSVTLTERLKKRLEHDPSVQRMAEAHLVGLAEPIDVANAALYLASDESRVVTGQIIRVDSGITIV